MNVEEALMVLEGSIPGNVSEEEVKEAEEVAKNSLEKWIDLRDELQRRVDEEKDPLSRIWWMRFSLIVHKYLNETATKVEGVVIRKDEIS